MKIMIAPDSYKGSLSALEVCNIMENAILEIMPSASIEKIPISDGGEGLVHTFITIKGGEIVEIPVKDPLLRDIQAKYGIIEGDTAVIEMAAASGLPLLTATERNPLLTNTYGTGEMIVHAVKQKGCRKIILGLGGSATNDGGMGLAKALGIKFYDEDNTELEPCGKNLSRIDQIDTNKVESIFSEIEITIACDVKNPLCGHLGSAKVYGPQKGATAEMVALLDQGLNQLGRLMENKSGKDLLDLKGIGAAGGMALPLVALFNAQLKSGLDIVLDEINFDEMIREIDLIITGEGKTDAQSAMGKVISGIAKRGKKQGIPVIVVSGALEEGYETIYEHGVTAAFSVYSNSESLEWHMTHAEKLLHTSMSNIFRLFSVIQMAPEK